MKRLLLFIIYLPLLLSCTTNTQEDTTQFVSFTDVALTGGFWQPRMQTELDITVPFSVQHCEPAVQRFRQCASYQAGDTTQIPFSHRFISSDMYKVMEGVAYSLMLRPNERLEAWMDSTIALIAASQQQDGYLYISHICKNPIVEEMGERPYSYVLHSHELYNMGHLYEAAVAYYEATGKGSLLEVAEKSAQHINKVFFEGDPEYNDGKPVMQAPGHEEIELALCKLYHATDNQLYLEMAHRFLDIRGVTMVPDGEGVCSPTYAQQHAPVREQREAVGHCVRAVYLYTGMAQVDALTQKKEYQEALDSIWNDLTSSRMHITGGLGADRRIEGFGEKYSLPNKEAYNETCAAVANVFFNNAMFLAERDAKYLDVAEISLFNNALAGISLSGDRFFYVNPLASDGIDDFNWGTNGRSEWFECACCPPNISRLILQVPGMMYSYSASDIYVTLYSSNETTVQLDECEVHLQQESDYPSSGNVLLKIDPNKQYDFALRLRIPTWCRTNNFMPGGLYSYRDSIISSYSIRVNGEEVDASIDKGFAVLKRTWCEGDVVELALNMPERTVVADERVLDDTGLIAKTKGPLVYCNETIEGITQSIPYYTWGNVNPHCQMSVWLHEK